MESEQLLQRVMDQRAAGLDASRSLTLGYQCVVKDDGCSAHFRVVLRSRKRLITGH